MSASSKVPGRTRTDSHLEGPGGSVAELPVFDGGKYPASCAAVDDAVLLFISKQDFHSLCLVHPQVALKVLKVVGRRLRALVNIIEELSFTTVRSRLISLLCAWAVKGSGSRRSGGHPAGQQPGTGLAHWHRPRTGLAQPQPPAGRRADPPGREKAGSAESCSPAGRKSNPPTQ